MQASTTELQAVLISNGPGELTTWLKPVLDTLRQHLPALHITIVLVPCQFASGKEAQLAASFGADSVMSVHDYLRFAASGWLPKHVPRLKRGFVLSLGGNLGMALRLAKALAYPCYRYSFVPWWHVRLQRLFVPDAATYRQARALGAPANKLRTVGNLVADALHDTGAATRYGTPQVLLMFGSRDTFAVHVIPMLLATADALRAHYPEMGFVAPRSRLLSDDALQQGICNTYAIDTIFPEAGTATRHGDVLHTAGGARIQLVPEATRHAHMKASNIAITIPGTNTLELGIAGLPALVLLPLNKPEVIPLEGVGHWLSLIPGIGTMLKRQAVRLAAPHLPVSLPNHMTGQDLMLEYKGIISLAGIVQRARQLLDDPEVYARRKRGLAEHMPRAGAAQKLVASILQDML